MALDSISNFTLVGAQIGLVLLQGLLFLSSLFLMLLVLVQRGKGGGLTGALGGQGGQSAFGSKAGDAFTKITIITSMVWIMLCMVTIAAYNPPPIAATADEKRRSGGIGAATDPAPKGETKAESKADGKSGMSATATDTKGADAGSETKTDDSETKSGGAIKLDLDGGSDTPSSTLPGASGSTLPGEGASTLPSEGTNAPSEGVVVPNTGEGGATLELEPKGNGGVTVELEPAKTDAGK